MRYFVHHHENMRVLGSKVLRAHCCSVKSENDLVLQVGLEFLRTVEYDWVNVSYTTLLQCKIGE